MTTDDPLPSISVSIHSLRTDDNILIDAVYADARIRRVGVIFIHGLGGNIFNLRHLWESVAKLGHRHGIGVLALQTRGHDIVAGYHINKKHKRSAKSKYKLAGSGLERFEDCTLDIGAGIRHMKRLGYKKIVLIGHSTGANKVAYYTAHKRDNRVGAVVLAGPARDITHNFAEYNSIEKYNKFLDKIYSYAKKNGKDALLPERLAGQSIISGRRYASLYKPGSKEDIFPYGEPKGSWATIGKITKPLFIIFGEEDPYLGENAPEHVVALMNAKAKKARSVSADIILGNGHSFREDPNAFAQSVTSWIRKTLL